MRLMMARRACLMLPVVTAARNADGASMRKDAGKMTTTAPGSQLDSRQSFAFCQP